MYALTYSAGAGQTNTWQASWQKPSPVLAVEATEADLDLDVAAMLDAELVAEYHQLEREEQQTVREPYTGLVDELRQVLDADFEEVTGEGSGNAIALTVNAPAAAVAVDDDRLAEEAFGANFDLIDWEEVQRIDETPVLETDAIIIPTHLQVPEVDAMAESANVLVDMFRHTDATGDLPPEVDTTPVPAPIEYGGFGDEIIDFSKLFMRAA